MRKLLLSLALAISAMGVSAQTGCTTGGGVTCTPNLNLWLLPQHYTNWGVPWNANATEVDTFSLTVPVFNPLSSQTITQPLTTYFNVNALMNFGSNPAVLFGVTAGAWDTALTRTGAGQFSTDTTTFGNGLASLTTAGIKIHGSSPSVGQCLTWGGTKYDTPVSCITTVGSIFYQTMQANGAAQTQRPALNFSSAFTLADSSSPARTNVDLAHVGTPGTYTSPSSVTFDVYGRETAITASSAINRVCSGTYPTWSCYRFEADGTIFAWGVVPAATSGGTTTTATITFPNTGPQAFTINPSLTLSLADNPGGSNDSQSIYFTGLSVSGATAQLRCAVNVGGSGCASYSNAVPVHWQAIGN